MRKFGGGGNNGGSWYGIFAPADHNHNHVSIGIRSGSSHKQQSRYSYHHHHRRLVKARKISIVGALIVFLVVAFIASITALLFLSSKDKDINSNYRQDDEIGNDTDFLTNVTRTDKSRVVKFGHGSVKHGRDSRYWDGDDRRRDLDYGEADLEWPRDGSIDKDSIPIKYSDKKSSTAESQVGSTQRGNGLYNEAGRNELKKYEAKYEASLKNIGQLKHDDAKQSHDASTENDNKVVDADDEYDDGIDVQDARMDDDDLTDHSFAATSHDLDGGDSSLSHESKADQQNFSHEMDEYSSDASDVDSVSSKHSDKDSKHVSSINSQSVRKSGSEKRPSSKKKSKRRKFSGSCEMKLLNSSALIVEPLESRKFARFSLQYTEMEEKPIGDEKWEPRFSGHQTLQEREEVFIAHDQKINCGFVKGPKGYPSTGFDLAEDDAKYISSCHIAVVSCIFGNSDRLRIPVEKMVSRLSRKNVCFVMFVDEVTLQTLSSEGHLLDRMGFIGLWKIVVVKNLPSDDMRRVGKIPKLLSHRLFSSARYSIWLDSKLRLQLDPYLILEYFLWRKGHEYAISNHYDRHCVWQEVAQNKRLNKYNHTVIDEQFAFYQADGLKKFNASDPHKLLPSNVPEGSFIVRAHTPMSNLFSCLWFNEVDRFTPRDQLSFAYTYYKLRSMNPEKPFYLNMFKDCERRKIAKLFRHRSDEKRNMQHHETE